MFSEPFGQRILAEFTRSDLQSDGFQFLWIRQIIEIVDAEEHQSRQDRRPLVPIDKGMILSDMKHVGRSHRGKILMEIGCTELLARHCHGSIQQTMIPYTVGSAVNVDGIGVEQQNVVHAEEDDIVHRISPRAALTSVHIFSAAL